MYLNEWMYFRNSHPKALAKQTGLTVEEIQQYRKAFVDSENGKKICDALHITPYQMCCVNPMGENELNQYTISTTSFKEMVRLQNYFRECYGSKEIQLWVFDHGRGEYHYQIQYCRRLPLSLKELHLIVSSEKYKDFREEHQTPSSYFDDKKIRVIPYYGEQEELV